MLRWSKRRDRRVLLNYAFLVFVCIASCCCCYYYYCVWLKVCLFLRFWRWVWKEKHGFIWSGSTSRKRWKSECRDRLGGKRVTYVGMKSVKRSKVEEWWLVVVVAVSVLNGNANGWLVVVRSSWLIALTWKWGTVEILLGFYFVFSVSLYICECEPCVTSIFYYCLCSFWFFYSIFLISCHQEKKLDQEMINLYKLSLFYY
jgi:hypothetical protein